MVSEYLLDLIIIYESIKKYNHSKKMYRYFWFWNVYELYLYIVY